MGSFPNLKVIREPILRKNTLVSQVTGLHVLEQNGTFGGGAAVTYSGVATTTNSRSGSGLTVDVVTDAGAVTNVFVRSGGSGYTPCFLNNATMNFLKFNSYQRLSSKGYTITQPEE